MLMWRASLCSHMDGIRFVPAGGAGGGEQLNVLLPARWHHPLQERSRCKYVVRLTEGAVYTPQCFCLWKRTRTFCSCCINHIKRKYVYVTFIYSAGSVLVTEEKGPLNICLFYGYCTQTWDEPALEHGPLILAVWDLSASTLSLNIRQAPPV